MKTLLILVSLMLLAGIAPANPNELSVWESVDLASVNGNEVTSTRSVWDAVDTARALDYTTWQATGYQPPLTPQNEYRNPYDAFTIAAYPPVAYFPPTYYTAAYPPQSAQHLVDWLWGAPRQHVTPTETANVPVLQPEPTPQPIAAAATEPVSRPLSVAQAGVMAPTITSPLRLQEGGAPQPDALPELTLLDMLAYWTRKIVMTGLLLLIIGFAYHKRRTAEQSASRRIAALEDELQRLDHMIYGAEHTGGNAP